LRKAGCEDVNRIGWEKELFFDPKKLRILAEKHIIFYFSYTYNLYCFELTLS
jgi:hypothetical protein